jgi:hypothetical protein
MTYELFPGLYDHESEAIGGTGGIGCLDNPAVRFSGGFPGPTMSTAHRVNRPDRFPDLVAVHRQLYSSTAVVSAALADQQSPAATCPRQRADVSKTADAHHCACHRR